LHIRNHIGSALLIESYLGLITGSLQVYRFHKNISLRVDAGRELQGRLDLLAGFTRILNRNVEWLLFESKVSMEVALLLSKRHLRALDPVL